MTKTFAKLLKTNQPLVIAGAVNAFSAVQASQVGMKSLYVSGAGVANASFGLPDLGVTSLNDVAEDVARITSAVDTPVLVDIDTGFGGAFNIARTIKTMIRSGAKAVHMEDQVSQKRCGHRPNKELVSADEMIDRIKAAKDAMGSDDLYLIGRTDAVAVEGIDAALERAHLYAQAGVDAIFAEAVIETGDFARFKKASGVPILANMTEFGKTPYRTAAELGEAGADMVLYPLSAFRAMSKAAQSVYSSLLEDKQTSQLDNMQTREELYQTIGYYRYEEYLDKLFSKETS